jgi:hypothetical protein
MSAGASARGAVTRGAGGSPLPLGGTSAHAGASDATADEPLLLRALPVLLTNLLSHAPARLGWRANPSLAIGCITVDGWPCLARFYHPILHVMARLAARRSSA